jgi:succinate-semialdehyde dehydrogenase/glutarate-semialdehyde dehydrogenase
MNIRANYLNGEWVGSAESSEVVSPATGQVIAKVAAVSREQVRQALVDAQTAFAGWKTLTAKARADYLLAIAAELNRRTDEIARTMTSEAGKPLAQSRGEVQMSVDHLRWFAEECRRGYGRVIPHQTPGKRNFVIRQPVGVVGAIAPWNFPLVLSVRKVAPALAAGCPTILKPASQTPLCNLAFAECCETAKLPRGVLQVINGSASMIGEEFLNNSICRKITFTGSTEVGQKLIAGAARDVKKLSLELGGNAPCLVFDDADLNRAVDGVILAKFRNTGQSCIAANRIYVQSGIYDRFVAAFVEKVKALKTGDGLEGEQDVGPVINEKGLKFVLEQIEDAKRRGAKVLAGGKRMNRPGYFLEPTVLVDVPDDASCMHEEIFAPVAPIARFEKEADAIARANSTQFGLSSYCFTTNLDRMFRVAEGLEFGMVGVNDGVPTTSNAPFGGWKHSGWGRELGSEGLDAFLETKHISIGVME